MGHEAPIACAYQINMCFIYYYYVGRSVILVFHAVFTFADRDFNPSDQILQEREIDTRAYAIHLISTMAEHTLFDHLLIRVCQRLYIYSEEAMWQRNS